MSTTVVGRVVRVFGGQLAGLGPRPIELSTEPIVIGRAEGCGVRLDDPKVSSVHFEITATARGVRVRDLGSTNGTWTDGNECVEMYLLYAAEVRCGDTVFRFTPGKPIDVDLGGYERCGDLVGTSEPMKALYQRIRRIASTDLPALIEGETGTGKELVANAIHRHSARAANPFIVIDCGALPRELTESILFGHERGAFTGATERRTSPFVEAGDGTVFLDEIGELPLELQSRLLRVLEQREIKAVGSSSFRQVNARIIAATRRDLKREVNENRFRSDLYFRLRVLPLEVPRLRDHREDVQVLAEHLARGLGFGDSGTRFTRESFLRMQQHDWPGNVRELRNMVADVLTFAPAQGPIDATGYWSPASSEASVGATANFFAAREEFERRFWQYQIATKRSIAEIARATGVERGTVRNHLRKFGLRKDED